MILIGLSSTHQSKICYTLTNVEIELTKFAISFICTPPPPPILWLFSFFHPPPIKTDFPHGTPLPTEKQPPPHHWKVKPASRKWFLEKNLEKSETVINICVSIIKQHWKKMPEIPQERDFLTWSIQNFVKKVKKFVRKIYITWLNAWLTNYMTQKNPWFHFTPFVIKNCLVTSDYKS